MSISLNEVHAANTGVPSNMGVKVLAKANELPKVATELLEATIGKLHQEPGSVLGRVVSELA